MRAPGVPGLLLLVLLAGCVEPPAAGPTEDAAAAPGMDDALVTPTFRAPLVLGAVGITGAEPSVAADAQGRVFVAAAPALWRSLDGGATFERLDAELAGFTGDADLAVDAAGTLYFAGLGGKDASLPFQASRDGGATWTAPVDLAEGNLSDRQWLVAHGEGTVYATWRDFGAPDDEDAPARVVFRASRDGGATWGPLRVVGDDALQGPLARDPASGALYTAFYDEGIRVARSLDEGETWSVHAVTTGARDTTLRPGRPTALFPVAAVDAAGAVYVAWSEDSPELAPAGAKGVSPARVRLAVSTDMGETWRAPLALSPPDRSGVLPWIVAGQAGRVAVAWYESRHTSSNEDLPDVWDVRLVESVDAHADSPVFQGGLANDEPAHVGAICTNGGGCDRLCLALRCLPTRVCDPGVCVGKDRSRLEFFELALGADGHPLLAWVADPAAPREGVRIVAGGVADGTRIG